MRVTVVVIAVDSSKLEGFGIWIADAALGAAPYRRDTYISYLVSDSLYFPCNKGTNLADKTGVSERENVAVMWCESR